MAGAYQIDQHVGIDNCVGWTYFLVGQIRDAATEPMDRESDTAGQMPGWKCNGWRSLHGWRMTKGGRMATKRDRFTLTVAGLTESELAALVAAVSGKHTYAIEENSQ